MPVDRDSPPGSWAEEMDRAPWAFGQHKVRSVPDILAKIRQCGLTEEANYIALEFEKMEVELARARNVTR